MANMLVAYGQKRNRDTFNPHNGMVAEPTKDNVQEALEGQMQFYEDTSGDWKRSAFMSL